MFDGKVCLCQKLSQETRDLVLPCAGVTLVIDKCYVLGTLDETIEIVSIYGYLVVERGEAKGFAEIVRNEAAVCHLLGKVAFANAEHQDVAKVQGTCFEDSHHLKSDGGFAMEGNCLGAKD